MWKSDDGRILIVEVEIGGTKIIIVNIYAPNSQLTQFYNRLYHKVLTLEYDGLYILGDFNAVPDSLLDRSRGRRSVGLLPKIFFDMMGRNHK